MKKQQVIAIDCDDVLIVGSDFVVAEYNRRFGTNVQLAHAHMSNNSEWEAERSEVFRRLNDIQHSEEYAAILPPTQTIQSIKRLAVDHELHLITARTAEVERVTLQMLKTHFSDCFTSVEHVGPDKSKGEVCERIGADVLIDDNVKHLESAMRHGVKGRIWFGDYPWQSENDSAAVTARCLDWGEVEKLIGRA